jgi:hypothetical protein
VPERWDGQRFAAVPSSSPSGARFASDRRFWLAPQQIVTVYRVWFLRPSFCSTVHSFITEVSHMNATVSILAEIPEDLHLSLKGYLETHPDWDQDRVFCAALSLFLLQHVSSNSPTTAHCYRRAARVYLDTLFKHAV